MRQSIDDLINDYEYSLAKLQFVKSHYPDVKVSGGYLFSSKTVNSTYTKWDFDKNAWSGLRVVPYNELTFSHNGEDKIIRVHSSPKYNRLAYFGYKRVGDKHVKTLRFGRVAINFKTNNFKEEMLNSCRAEIMKFVSENPKCELDTKHLEPRLKKLLAFT